MPVGAAATRAVAEALKLAPKTAEVLPAAASSRLLAARQIAERVGGLRTAGRVAVAVDDLSGPFRDGIDWMLKRDIIARDAVEEIADAASLIRGATDEDDTRRLLRRDFLALSESPNAEMTAAFQRNVAAAAKEGATGATFAEAMDDATKGAKLPGFADAYLENVYRTETANIYQAQRLATMAEPEVADLVWGVELFAINDDRARPSHAAVDGLLLRKGSEAYNAWLPGPPYSYQCRCTSAVVLKSEGGQEPGNALALVRSIERFT